MRQISNRVVREELTVGPCGPVPAPGRATVLPFEAAVVLEIAERDAKGMIRRGELAEASLDRWWRIDVVTLRQLVESRVAAEELSPLALYLLDELVAGRLRVRRPKTTSEMRSIVSVAYDAEPVASDSRTAGRNALHQSTSVRT